MSHCWSLVWYSLIFRVTINPDEQCTVQLCIFMMSFGVQCCSNVRLAEQRGCMPDLTPQSLMDGAQRVQLHTLRKLNQPWVPACFSPRKVHMLKEHFHSDAQLTLSPTYHCWVSYRGYFQVKGRLSWNHTQICVEELRTEQWFAKRRSGFSLLKWAWMDYWIGTRTGTKGIRGPPEPELLF